MLKISRYWKGVIATPNKQTDQDTLPAYRG